MVSECKEEGDLVLPDGRNITYTTATSSYDTRKGVGFVVRIDAAEDDEPEDPPPRKTINTGSGGKRNAS